ncbi:MAG: NAD(P)H-hydrate epimerase [Gammaproteobacteria bacterium HGW-Gammaproteobacteria-4]|jgi:NAD(P)H-hydrate epimerase|nr:MAG: NAD(P)H-hydrate epimerase [Gammaproteobacteria bacterium HGW-Gammaproteobacteria-4]
MRIASLTAMQRAACASVSGEQMALVDARTIDGYGVSLIQMMENAGRNLARLARDRFFAGDARGRTVHVLAGPGGNGGGVLAAARRLHGCGAAAQVWLAQPDRMSPAAAQQWASLQRLGVRLADAGRPGDGADLLLDGLLGYRLRGQPSACFAELIAQANAVRAPILAMDLPSGLDPDRGIVNAVTVQATVTLTLAAPKPGLLAEAARAVVGELYLADIGVPPAVYADLGLAAAAAMVDVFATDDIQRWM